MYVQALRTWLCDIDSISYQLFDQECEIDTPIRIVNQSIGMDQKIPVTIKLDRKVIEFFKEHSKKYQVKINEVLLAFVKTYEKSHGH